VKNVEQKNSVKQTDDLTAKKHRLICGDCTKVMLDFAAESIDLVVTSPPYHVNKAYEKDWTREYFNSLMLGVFEGVKHVLKPGGYFVVNFGDCYNSGNRFYEADVPSVYPASLSYFEWGRHVGFDLQATRIWRKRFAKMGIPFVCNSHPRNIFDYEHIWSFRKKNGSNVEVVHDRKLSQRGVIGEDWSSSAKLEQHEAAFPVELPAWAISVYSKEGDTVLDPFTGSGTTGVAAKSMNRNFVGIEISSTYFSLAQKNIEHFQSIL
jgi:DNA modification methylase